VVRQERKSAGLLIGQALSPTARMQETYPYATELRPFGTGTVSVTTASAVVEGTGTNVRGSEYTVGKTEWCFATSGLSTATCPVRFPNRERTPASLWPEDGAVTLLPRAVPGGVQVSR